MAWAGYWLMILGALMNNFAGERTRPFTWG